MQFIAYLLSQLEGFGAIFIYPLTELTFELYKLDLYWPFVTLLSILSIVTWWGVGYVLAGFLPRFSSEKSAKKDNKKGKLEIGLVIGGLSAYLLGVSSLVIGLTVSSIRNIFFLLFAVHPVAIAMIAPEALTASAVTAWIFWIGIGLSFIIKKYSKQIKVIAIAAFLFLSLSTFLAKIFTQDWYYADQAHHLHALVKNTCMFDPQKEHCPRTVADFEILEPEFFNEMKHRNQVRYKISDDQNHYVMLVRYDKQLSILFWGGLDENGQRSEDFKIFTVNTVGQDRVQGLPEFAKEFEYLPEWKWPFLDY